MLLRSLFVGTVATVLMAAPTVLLYNAKPGASVPVQGGFTLTFDVVGPPEITTKLRAANVILGIDKLQVRGMGRRTVVSASSQGNLMRLAVEKANVSGTYLGKPFKYDFAGPTAPATLQKDEVGQFAFAISMGGRTYTLGPKGDYLTGSADDDAAAEAMSVIIDAPVRLSDTAVDIGQSWTREWTGARRNKDNGGVFHYKQTATIKSLVKGRALIDFSVSGRLDIPADRNPQKEETTLELTGTVTLDSTTGMVVASRSSGTVATAFEGGTLRLTRRIDANFTE